MIAKLGGRPAKQEAGPQIPEGGVHVFVSRATVVLSTGALVLAGSLGAAAAVSAAGASPHSDDEIHACVDEQGGLFLAYHDACYLRESPISWPRHSVPSITEDAVLSTKDSGTQFPVTTTPTDVTGLSVTLPVPGQYVIGANVRGMIVQGSTPAPLCYIVAQLATGPTGATVIPDSQRLVVIDDNGATGGSNAQATAPIGLNYTAKAPNTVVTVQAFQGGGCAGASPVAIVSDLNGASTLSARLVALPDNH
jgi:hypothetical protein